MQTYSIAPFNCDDPLLIPGLECLCSELKCMVEWSREYYIDPATTGLNTVYRSSSGDVPEDNPPNEFQGSRDQPGVGLRPSRTGSVGLRPSESG